MRLAALALAACTAGTVPAVADPFAALGGDYRLVDHTGAPRTEADPDGHAQLLFFGYANCQQICSAALPTMARTAEILEAEGHAVTPVMITVDPTQDTREAMTAALRQYHPDFVGLTGRKRALQRAYDAFGIEIEELFVDPEYGPVYAHGSFIYLLDGAGQVLTALPPILSADQMAEIAQRYLAAG